MFQTEVELVSRKIKINDKEPSKESFFQLHITQLLDLISFFFFILDAVDKEYVYER